MNKLSRTILKVHAVFLFVLPVMMSTAGLLGLHVGIGPFAGLQDVPIALLGLIQAYLLMLLIGVSIWIGADGERIWRWSLVAITAHCIPLLAIALLWNAMAANGILHVTTYSYMIHGSWIAIELLSLAVAARTKGTMHASF